MNNNGYTIEAEIHDGPYNRIQNWNYALFVQAFNSNKTKGCALGLKADSIQEFSNALVLAQSHTNGPALIECRIERDNCTKELITWVPYVANANNRASN